jgi:hypothetical protein
MIMVSCAKENKGTLYKAEDVESLNAQIEANTDWQLNSDLIAREYFAQLYPNFKNEYLTVSTNWKDSLLHVTLTEDPSSFADYEAAKVVIIFQRPMGVHRVEKIKHSWKCRGRSVFSGQACKQ